MKTNLRTFLQQRLKQNTQEDRVGSQSGRLAEAERISSKPQIVANNNELMLGLLAAKYEEDNNNNNADDDEEDLIFSRAG